MLRAEHPPQELSPEERAEGIWHCWWLQFSRTEEVSAAAQSLQCSSWLYLMYDFFLYIKWSLNKTLVVLDIINMPKSKRGSSGACVLGWGGISASAAADEGTGRLRSFFTPPAPEK